MPKSLTFQALDTEALRFLAVEKEAQELMEKHGLIELGWRFELTKEKTFLGYCWYDRKLICFSEYWLHVPAEQITDTLLHEIAHALVWIETGKNHGHDYVWKRKCREIGAAPERCAPREFESSAEPNYVIVCTGCGEEQFRRYRLRPALINRYRSRCCGATFEAYTIGKGE